MAEPSCAFCGRSRVQVTKLVAGPSACICEECVLLSAGILLEEQTVAGLLAQVAAAVRSPSPTWPVRPLLDAALAVVAGDLVDARAIAHAGAQWLDPHVVLRAHDAIPEDQRTAEDGVLDVLALDASGDSARALLREGSIAADAPLDPPWATARRVARGLVRLGSAAARDAAELMEHEASARALLTLADAMVWPHDGHAAALRAHARVLLGRVGLARRDPASALEAVRASPYAEVDARCWAIEHEAAMLSGDWVRAELARDRALALIDAQTPLGLRLRGLH